MRIQHNITAMNSYRNYNANASAVAKSLEKLSSGYRINRAGDDAAGLAISEKMRAQIAGLEQAQSNAKSGINLVQTAEGAMTEIHDMLNRMYTLAEQSANGTYDDDVDRNQLQKELTSLKQEIDRIADSANYNGIKLLDGGLDGNVKIGKDDMSRLNLSGINSYMGKSQPGDTAGAANWESGIIVHKEAAGAAKSSFEIELGTLGADLATGETTGTLKLALFQATDEFNAPNMSIKEAGGDYKGTAVNSVDIEITGETTATDIGEKFLKLLDADGDGVATIKLSAGGGDTVANMVEYNVTFDRDNKVLRFEMSDDGYKFAAGEATKSTGATDKYFASNFSFKAEPDKATVNGMKNYGATNTVDGSAASATQLAHTMIAFQDGDAATDSGMKIADGAGVQIGDQYYIWGGSDRTVNASYGSNVHVVDVRDIVEAMDGN